MQTIIPTHHEKLKWARMAQDAYRMGLNQDGHRFSAWAALPNETAIDIGTFDALQAYYREWLIDGFTPTVR